ncbi:MAG: hypothetical protein ABWX73_07195 [Marmoricola sp.]
MTASASPEQRSASGASKAAAVYRRFPDLQPTQLPATPAEPAEVASEAA